MTAQQFIAGVIGANARHNCRLRKLKRDLEPKDPIDAPLSAYARYDEAVADENQAYTDEIMGLVERYTSGSERKGKARK